MVPAGVLASLLLTVGCAEKPDDRMVRVQGTVTLDGRPLEAGTVQFQPAKGQVAVGKVGPGGGFTLSTFASDDGVLPGTYRVSVIAHDPAASEQTAETLIVPVKYTRFGTSGLEFTIFPGAKEPLAVELVSEAAATGAADPGAAEGEASGSSAEDPSPARAPDATPAGS